jgi:hypothetical protein
MPGLGLGLSGWSLFTSFVEVIAFVILVGVVWGARKEKYVSGATIVLRRFHLDENPAARVAVEISGRASGFVAWVLTLLKLEPDFELAVTNSEFTIRSASLGGTQFTYVPLEKVTSTVCGYQRSILAFAFAIYFGIIFVLNLFGGVFFSNSGSETGGYMGEAFIALVVAGIAAGLYFLSKQIVISAETLHPHGLRFKRSVIENVSIDLPEAIRAIAIINARVLAAQAGYTQSVVNSPSAGPAPVSGSSGAQSHCPKCLSLNPANVHFCGNCGVAIPSLHL